MMTSYLINHSCCQESYHLIKIFKYHIRCIFQETKMMPKMTITCFLVLYELFCMQILTLIYKVH